ncbi:HAD family hydrolase [Carboxylicivirga sediminis]|uniref:HAD family hydrolase n=1 Tax=Carboxylicivirga sediminis TaxID=2006564 RepID=A0A941F8L8_9BACT|nr:HAD family hydrolase [Carboxylicivirga sediminis]MBR8537668.1 HAD family hydrolase [Carboxylicivirga sediminis]
MNKIPGIKVIAFDADDTLWENETFFREAENQFAELIKDYAGRDEVLRILYEVEMANMPVYGYGIKAFILSLIETAQLLSGFRITARQTSELIDLGKEMLKKPVVLLEGVEEVLQQLHGHYKLIVATKGDLLDQERKLEKSGLGSYFHHIEVMSDKHTEAYRSLIAHLDCQPKQVLMVGNSLKSDVLPILECGGWGAHIPFHTTWHHELVTEEIVSNQFYELTSIKQLPELVF